MSKRVGLRTMPSIGAAPCAVTIRIYQDGEATSEHTIKIAAKSYSHSDTPRFAKGTYSLSWNAGNEAYFYKWETAENIAVENEYEGTTNLTVSCGGTLTLKLTSKAAFNYDNLVGAIWLEGNPSGYDNSHTGQIEVKEPAGLGLIGEIQGGCYDNRA